VSTRARTALSREEPLAARQRPKTEVAVLESSPSVSPEALSKGVLGELKSAMRGRSLHELTELLGVPAEALEGVCALLTARGQVVRRGTKLFVA
jgi:hypothetical protein